MCLDVPFHVKKRYTLVRELGVGAYGCVALAFDEQAQRQVAIKKVSNFFDQEVLTRRTLREVASLSHLVDCPNVVQILDFDVTFIDLNEVYFILKACDADLCQIIRSDQALTESHIRFFMVQLLRGVHAMHNAHIIHRDLKPGNLLVNTDCRLFICDFGMSRAFESLDSDYLLRLSRMGSSETSTPTVTTPDGSAQDPFSMGTIDVNGERRETPLTDTSDRAAFMQFFYAGGVDTSNDKEPRPISKPPCVHFPGGPLTDYVATRWYRAPEIMLRYKGGYTPAMDIWSVGCILAELLGRRPIFPGTDYMDQLSRMNKVLGGPAESLLTQIGSSRARHHVKSLPPSEGIPWSTMYPDAPALALDLLDRLIQWDPEKRITAGEALAHPWLKRYWQGSLSTHLAPPFQQFTEIEMIHTPKDFKTAFENQCDAIRIVRTPSRLAEASMNATSPDDTSSSMQDLASDWQHNSPQSAGTMTMDSSSPSTSGPDSDHDYIPNEHLHDDQSCASMSPMTSKPRGQDDTPEPSQSSREAKLAPSEHSGFSLLSRARALIHW